MRVRWSGTTCCKCGKKIMFGHGWFFWHTVARKARHISCEEPTERELYKGQYEKNRPIDPPEPVTGSGIYDEDGHELS